jgi:hypothetical protein
MRRALVVIAALLLAGCGSIDIGTPPPASGPQQEPGATETVLGVMSMCVLMPLGVVQEKSPFQTPLAQAKAGTLEGMCEYRSADDATDPVSVLLSVTDFGSKPDAQTSLANARQAAVDAGLPVDDLNGLADGGFSSGVDEVGVHARLDNMIIDANFGGEWPDTTDDAKVTAGKQLIRTIVDRLP